MIKSSTPPPTTDQPTTNVPKRRLGFIRIAAGVIALGGVATGIVLLPPWPKQTEPIHGTHTGSQGTQQTPPKPPPAPKKEFDTLTAITFANDRGTTYVLARDVAKILGDQVEVSPDKKNLTIDKEVFSPYRKLFAGDALIPIREIKRFQGVLVEDPATHELVVTVPQGEFRVKVGEKRIEVDKATQELTAYQGDIVVIKTKVSTGRPGHGTPSGDFVTGPDKEIIHYSHKYNDAPMPFAIQVHDDVFLHGYTSVPRFPASHGCVRIPLNHKNPAKYLFGWAGTGIPTKIFGTFDWEAYAKRRHRKRRH